MKDVKEIIALFENLQENRRRQFDLIRQLVEIAYENSHGARHDLNECVDKFHAKFHDLNSDWFDGTEPHTRMDCPGRPCQNCRCRGALKALLDVLPRLGEA